MVESPCTSVCEIELESGFCKGCSRTSDEITGWIRYSDAVKKEILLKINNRRIDNRQNNMIQNK